MATYTREFDAPCAECKKPKAVLSTLGEPGLRIARHLHAAGSGFCRGSFEPYKRPGKERAA